MLDTIAHINILTEEAGITEVSVRIAQVLPNIHAMVQPSLLNFCVTDGESVIATRYISSRQDEAASLVRVHILSPGCSSLILVMQWFSSGTTFSEYAEGGHYRMSKLDKRENIVMVMLPMNPSLPS